MLRTTTRDVEKGATSTRAKSGPSQHDFAGKSVERIYNDLLDQQPSPPDSVGESGVDPEQAAKDVEQQSTGQPREAAGGDDLQQQWQERLKRASETANMCGELPAGIESIVDDFQECSIHWIDFLKSYAKAQEKRLLNWKHANMCYWLCCGTFIPSRRNKAMNTIVVCLDNSGSCIPHREKIVSEAVGIFRAFPKCMIRFITFDMDAHHVCDWRPGQRIPFVKQGGVKLVGGGGTAIGSCFDLMRKARMNGDVVIVMTDMDSPPPDRKQNPGCDVVYVSTDDSFRGKMPFGEITYFNKIARR